MRHTFRCSRCRVTYPVARRRLVVGFAGRVVTICEACVETADARRRARHDPFCRECAGLPWRVAGLRCWTCGLSRGVERVARAEPRTESPIARCLEGA
jgi:hypothetical protein